MSKKFSDFLADNRPSKILTDKPSIEKWLNAKEIQNYAIHDDGTVDVSGNVSLTSSYLSFIPVKFGVVNGAFCVNKNKLTSLEGCPHTIYGYFDCSDNPFMTLSGAPTEVAGSLYINNTPNLQNLIGLPKIIANSNDTTIRVSLLKSGITSLEGHRGYTKLLHLEDCRKLTSLHNIHKQLDTVNHIFLNQRLIKSHVLGILLVDGLKFLTDPMPDTEWFTIVRKYIGNDGGKNAVIDCQNELLDAGLDDYAQL